MGCRGNRSRDQTHRERFGEESARCSASLLRRDHRQSHQHSALRFHGTVGARSGPRTLAQRVGAGAGVIRAIVLAAGKGTRMKSSRTKVLHEICGRPMLWYVLESLRRGGIEEIVVVVNDELNAEMAQFGVPAVLQSEQRGTGDAVRVALERLDPRSGGRVVVTCGDMPLVPPEVFVSILRPLDAKEGVAMSLLTAKMPLPSNFGRIVRKGTHVERIVEASDATPQQLALDEMNAGIYAFDEGALRDAVTKLRNDNAQREYYLTDVVAYFVGSGRRVEPVAASDFSHVLGINDRAELALARREMNARLCAQHMADGVTIVDPATTYLEPELRIGADTVIYPNSTISRLSELGSHCTIGPNSRLSNARLGDRVTVRESVIVDASVGDDTSIGPFAHLRGGAALAQDVRVGNFVEIKNSQLAARVKAGHLAYLGDATVGEDSNVGAGTITCNFDGERKNETTIGRGVSIGSNTSLVAPVTLGDGSLTGAGSVVTRDVPAGERVAGNPARPLPKK
ncbi:MAG: bifunctional UDP-N-acetylglucosamine diphosphorylase/glucosamine-1-phosphate N-acetyltransferase GlmU [Candidatus Eremiobacteraeota bacterium]|nr:bifunctional UDP-N-acetylglucosamine diphosphorylase/glucosamine-1-phosphate N-acetyltransferase GlmU [Candidatus Eremiobacteraeota bacterium]